MKWNRCLKGLYAVPTISVALFASLFFVGISGSIEGNRAAFGATLQDMANNSMLITEGSFNNNNMSRSSSSIMREQNLTDTSIPVTLPLTPGYANGHEVFYISTEASDRDLAALMTNWTGARVVYAPSLANTPPAALANIYAFKNGIEGSGPLGFQPNVADSEPGNATYSPLWRIILVQWKEGISPTELKSEREIIAALQEGRLTIEPTKMVVNCPFIQWGEEVLLWSEKTRR
jgi:hypothetical protein